MSAALTALLLAATPVRAEPVEALPFSEEQSRTSTSSARTEERRQAETALDAERAFARAAETEGTWTAFRRFAAPDATMFTPQPVNAQAFLKPLKDPPRPIRWSPTAGWASCDGRWAVNTGEWRRPDGSVGYFSTVWTRTAAGWRWIVDGGDQLSVARTSIARPVVRQAACAGKPTPLPRIAYREGASDQRAAPDGTLAYRWHVSGSGARTFEAWLWTAKGWTQVLNDSIAGQAR